MNACGVKADTNSCEWQVKLRDPLAIGPYLSALEMRFTTKRYTNTLLGAVFILLQFLFHMASRNLTQPFRRCITRGKCRKPLECSRKRHPVHLKYRETVGVGRLGVFSLPLTSLPRLPSLPKNLTPAFGLWASHRSPNLGPVEPPPR